MREDALFSTTLRRRGGTLRQFLFLLTALLVLSGMGSRPAFAVNGLLAQYYNDPNNRTYFNVLALTRVDATINFDWGNGSPGDGVNADDFSARWTGLIETTTTGTYTFKTTSDDGIRLWIGDTLVVDSWIDQSPTDHTGTITLAGGTQYSIRLEFYERGGGAVARLRWTPPGGSEEIVPTNRLCPPPDNIVATPQITPVNALVSDSVVVAITTATPEAAIHYTTDGTAPTTSSPLYPGPFRLTISSNTYVTARAFKTGLPDSAASTVFFRYGSMNFTGGFSDLSYLQLNGNSALNGSFLMLTNGTSQTSSVFTRGTVDITAFMTTFTFSQQPPNPQFAAEGMTFTIQGVGPTALGGATSGLGYTGIGNSVCIKFDISVSSGEPSTSTTGMYLNGENPYGGTNLLPGINLRSGDVMRADIVYVGSTLTVTLTDTVTNATDTRNYTVNIPAVVGGNRAYIGFTGSTNGFYIATQQVRTWLFQNNSAVIAGHIALEDCVSASVPLTFEFRPTNASAPFTRTVTPAANGSFSVYVPHQSYNLAIKGSKWLQRTLAVNTTGGDVLNLDVLLLGGDANNDNSVDVLDLDVLIQSFDLCQGDAGFIAGADYNNDNCVDVLDLDILIRNFDAVGDP